jgi:fatty-acyl-CoA synthase
VVDAASFGDRGGQLAAGNGAPRVVLTLGPADYGHDLLRQTQTIGAATLVDLARSAAMATCRPRSSSSWPTSTCPTTELAGHLANHHVAGAEILTSLIRGGTTHLLRGFDPEQVLATIARRRINVVLLAPTMIYARSPYLVDEYWKRPQQTAEFLQGGWLNTGDLARTDEEGCLFIVDRKQEMIVSGGVNI